MNSNDKAREQVLAIIKDSGGYTVIPDIFSKLKLKPIKLLLLAEIHRYSQSNKPCVASYNRLKEKYNIARSTAIDALDSLVKDKLLIKVSGDSKTMNSYKVDYITINNLLKRYTENQTSTKIGIP